VIGHRDQLLPHDARSHAIGQRMNKHSIDRGPSLTRQVEAKELTPPNIIGSAFSSQHQAKPPAGFRQQDRPSPDAESTLQIGKRLDPAVHHFYPAPPDLRRQLPTPDKSSRYVARWGRRGGGRPWQYRA
jgi:hypothetical protein